MVLGTRIAMYMTETSHTHMEQSHMSMGQFHMCTYGNVPYTYGIVPYAYGTVHTLIGQSLWCMYVGLLMQCNIVQSHMHTWDNPMQKHMRQPLWCSYVDFPLHEQCNIGQSQMHMGMSHIYTCMR